MSQIGEPGAAAATMGSEPAGQAASQTSQLPPQGQQSQQQVDDQFIRYPKNSPGLQAYGGRYGEVDKAALQFRQAEQEGVFELAQVLSEQGYSVRQVIEHLRSQGATAAQANAAVQQAQQGGDPLGADQPQYLTAEEAKKIMAETLEQHTQKQTKAQEESQRQQAAEAARASENSAMLTALEQAGFKAPETGRSPKFDIAARTIVAHLDAIKQQAFTPYMADPPRLREWKLQQHMAQAATPAQVKAAMEATIADLKDLGVEAVAQFAQGQSQLPPSSLGGGPAGRVTTPNVLDLPADQMKAEVQRQVAARIGRR